MACAGAAFAGAGLAGATGTGVFCDGEDGLDAGGGVDGLGTGCDGFVTETGAFCDGGATPANVADFCITVGGVGVLSR